jgi:hypothetical protein
MSIYRTMWLDGRLLREAATCRTAAELAQRLGVSEEGLKRSLYTMRQAGEAVPLLKDLLGRPEREDLAGFGQQRPAVFPIGKDEPPFLYPDPTAGEGEDWEDERTSPGMTVPEIIGKADIGIEKSMEPIHMEQDVPEGFRVKGTSTYYDAAGKVIGQWVKTSRLDEDRLKAFTEAVAEIAAPFKGLASPVTEPGHTSSDLLCVYPMGDPHIGMYAWSQETGNSFDLEIAEGSLVAAVDHLVSLAPPSDEALIVNVGDFFHGDDSTNRTARSGNALDIDTRWSKVLGVGIRAMRRCIDRALEKHRRVTVINAVGNHDDHSSVMLAICLAGYYEREPRVFVDISPTPFHWYRFGKVFLGVTHGHMAKPEKLPGIMATDRPIDWGETLHRDWITGHLHHDILREFPGCKVHTIRTLAARDAWHNASGYRAGRDMKLFIYHREHGLINQHAVGIQQLTWGKAA